MAGRKLKEEKKNQEKKKELFFCFSFFAEYKLASFRS